MQIRKLDRNRLQDQPEEEIPPISYVEVKPEEEIEAFDIREIQEPQQIDSPEEINEEKTKQSRPSLFVCVIVILIVTSAFYFLTASQSASSFQDDWANQDILEKRSDFYALCNDIEGYKIAHGSYPESIEDLKYSDHITYVCESAQAFELDYADSMVELHYDSRVNKDKLK